MPANCSACKNRSNNGSKATFHKFPSRDKDCLKKWVAFVSKARGKGLWKPTVNSKLCSLHFEDNCFRYFNGRVYLNSGAAPSVIDIPEHLQKGTRCTIPIKESDASSVSSSPEVPTTVPMSQIEERAFDYEDKPLNSAPVKIAKLELSRLDEEQLRRALAPPPKGTPGPRMSVEAKEADGKRPIIVHVTSLSNSSEYLGRPTRVKRLPEKFRSGDYDREFAEEPPPKAPRVSSRLDTGPGISDDDDFGSESEDVDAPDLEEDEYEGSDTEVPVPTSSSGPATAYKSQPSCTGQGAKSVGPDGMAPTPIVSKCVSGATAGTLVELCTQLEEERARNEELSRQLTKAKEVIENQNRNIEALEDIINGLRQRVVAMGKKCGASTKPVDGSGDGKG